MSFFGWFVIGAIAWAGITIWALRVIAKKRGDDGE
jgi:hypothetical protein